MTLKNLELNFCAETGAREVLLTCCLGSTVATLQIDLCQKRNAVCDAKLYTLAWGLQLAGL